MSRKRKTPKPLAEVIMHRHPAMVAHLEEMLRVKRTVPVENQADHVRNRSEGEMIAFLEGASAMLEIAMHEFGCYAGFHNYGPEVATPQTVPGTLPGRVRYQVTKGHPDYEEWRRLYYTNGIAK